MHPAARLLLLLAVVSSLSAAVTADFVNSTCSAAGNYTDNSPYGQNVAELRSALATPPPATPGNHWWYRSRTVGQVSGLAMCYADADAKECISYLNNVKNSYYSLVCDHSRSLAYLSSVGFAFGYAPSSADSGDTSGARLILTSYSVVYGAVAAAMREARGALLSQLADRAGGDALRFAAGSHGYNDTTFHFSTWQVMYGMAQCALDLSPSECSKCLVDLLAVTYTVERATNTTSAQLMELTCYLRYQINKPITFIPDMVPAVPPAAPPAAPSGSAAASVAPPTPLVAALLAATAVIFFISAVFY
ncbi:unnamed protein product [Urochloa humidicola]